MATALRGHSNSGNNPHTATIDSTNASCNVVKEEDNATLYEVLGCDAASSHEQLLAEFRARVVDVHPDKIQHLGAVSAGDKREKAVSAAVARFHRLQFAREVLCDGQLRRHYDLYLSMGGVVGTGMSASEWMANREKLQQTFHWVQMVAGKQPTLPAPPSPPPQSCKSQLENERKGIITADVGGDDGDNHSHHESGIAEGDGEEKGDSSGGDSYRRRNAHHHHHWSSYTSPTLQAFREYRI